MDNSLITFLLFEFDTDGDFLRLENFIIDEKRDHDEYSVFRLYSAKRSILNQYHRMMHYENGVSTLKSVEPYRWHKFDIEEPVKSIQIYRAHAKWHYKLKRWEVTTDIAVKMSGDNFTFLFVLQDEVSGVIEVCFNDTRSDDEIIEKYWNENKWGMKSNKLDSLKREIIEI